MIEKVKIEVSKIFNQDKSGHDIKHTLRVLNLALKFSEQEPADKIIVALIALLHDVDDYKLFGKDYADNLTNAKNIMNKCNIDKNLQEQVLEGIKTIGFSKRLKGIIPNTIEAKIVSDADMCDGMGATGIIRTYEYNLAHGNPFFDKDIFPESNLASDIYTKKRAETAVNHIFEKLLKLKDLMLTESGLEEATSRHEIIVQFLSNFFKEQNVPEWTLYLNNYLKDKTRQI